jgi:hypothetical protein
MSERIRILECISQAGVEFDYDPGIKEEEEID